LFFCFFAEPWSVSNVPLQDVIGFFDMVSQEKMIAPNPPVWRLFYHLWSNSATPHTILEHIHWHVSPKEPFVTKLTFSGHQPPLSGESPVVLCRMVKGLAGLSTINATNYGERARFLAYQRRRE
jgi:hypothetical protein